jgi:hypothetical protein
VFCGETDQPVVGASVVVGGRSYTTDAGGEALLAEAATYGAAVDITADGFLPRQTALRLLGGTEFSLWPVTSPSGMSEILTKELIYTDATRCCPPEPGALGTAPLVRMRTGTSASVGMPDALTDTPAAMAIRDAIDLVNAATDGLVVFHLSGSPDGDVRISVNPTGRTPGGIPARAYFSAARQDHWITGGEVVLTSPDFAGLPEVPATESTFLRRFARTVAHEFGHCLGLQHVSEFDGIMGRWSSEWTIGQHGVTLDEARFSSAELSLLHLAYQRPAGNLFPDNDRYVRSTSARSRRIVCVIPPPS